MGVRLLTNKRKTWRPRRRRYWEPFKVLKSAAFGRRRWLKVQERIRIGKNLFVLWHLLFNSLNLKCITDTCLMLIRSSQVVFPPSDTWTFPALLSQTKVHSYITGVRSGGRSCAASVTQLTTGSATFSPDRVLPQQQWNRSGGCVTCDSLSAFLLSHFLHLNWAVRFKHILFKSRRNKSRLGGMRTVASLLGNLLLELDPHLVGDIISSGSIEQLAKLQPSCIF